MVNYRRDITPSGTYFFTLTLNDRASSTLTNYITSLGKSFRLAKANNYFSIEAIVILPDHFHMIMTLPNADAAYSIRIRQIKTYFTKEIISIGAKLSKNHRGEYNLWQRRFWEHRIRDDEDFENHVNYIHFNPIKHNLVKSLTDWPYSSFHRYVNEGKISRNLACTEPLGNFGE